MAVIEKSLVLSAMMHSVQGTFCVSIPVLLMNIMLNRKDSIDLQLMIKKIVWIIPLLAGHRWGWWCNHNDYLDN